MGSRRQWRRRRRALGIVLAALAVAACGSASNRPINGGVAYLIGYSTDPYGSSDPRGFGVATGITESPLRRTEATSPRAPSEIAWLGGRRLVVRSGAGLSGRPPAALFEVGDGRLERLDGPELRPEERTFAWSPDRKLLATQPWVPGGCEPGTLPQNCGITPGRDVYVQRSDGSHRRRVASGLLRGWTPDGRLLLFRGGNTDVATGSFVSFDLSTGRGATILSSEEVAAFAHRRAELGALAYSADGQYVATRALFSVGDVGVWGVVVARTDGRIVRLIQSRDLISMFAWSPRGHKLAFTTSGFPTPHELYVLSSPRATSRRILSQVEHFDWVTWSPDGRWLLIDNEHRHAWHLLRLTKVRQARLLGGAAVPVRRLPRLGGMPLWCCPQQTYGGS
jgi:dipeptidyl aminopeptidase/acylaminoacyl peptidase